MPTRASFSKTGGWQDVPIEPLGGILLGLVTVLSPGEGSSGVGLLVAGVMVLATMSLARNRWVASLLALAGLTGSFVFHIGLTASTLGTSLFVYHWMRYRRPGRWWLVAIDPLVHMAVWVVNNGLDDWLTNILAFIAFTGFVAVAGAMAGRKQEAAEQTKAEAEKALRATRLLVASELHDSVAQSQALLVMNLEELMDDPKLDEGLEPQVLEALELSRQAATELRAAMAALRNVDSDFHSLGHPAGHSLADQWAQVQAVLFDSGFAPEMRFEVAEMRVDREVEHALSRVLGELVANIVWHGRPGKCVVEVLAGDGFATVRTENEVGDEPASKGGGDGLAGMRQRVEMLGGTCEFGAQGSRWVSVVKVPV